jgi:hypothetical protein
VIRSVLAWVAVGWLGMIVWTALGSRIGVAHLLPDAGIVVIVFIALRRDPITVAVVSLCLGYLAGRQALAPVGQHEIAAMLCAIGAYLAGGSIAGSGAAFFALASGGAVGFYHLVIYLLGLMFGEGAGFPGWATATLVPSGLLTAGLAMLSHPLLSAIDRRLSADSREELSWR